MTWDTIDVAIANLWVWVAANGLWLTAVAAAFAWGFAAAAAWRQKRPEDRDDYRPTQDDMAGLIWRADWERTQREAAEAELRRLQRRLEAVDDAVRCAELELGWDRL